MITIAKVGVLLALQAGAELKPATTLAVREAELHGWAICGTQLAATVGKELIVGQLTTGQKKLGTPVAQPSSAFALAFTPDCKLLLASEQSGEGDKRVNGAALWRLAKGKLTRLAAIDTFTLPASSIAVSDDGAFAAIATNAGELFGYRLEAQGKATKVFTAPRLPKGDQFLRIRFGPGLLLGGTYLGSVIAYRFLPETGELGEAQALMTPTGATREKGSLNTTTGDIVMPGGARVFDVAFSNAGTRAWAVVESGQVFAWDLGATRGPRLTMVDGLDGANALAVSPDGTLLAAVGNFSARVWKVSGTTATLAGELTGLERVERYVIARGLQFFGKNQLAVGTGGLASARLAIFSL